MIAVCSLCGRQAEVEPLGRPESFYDLCDPCAHGIEARNPGLKLDCLTPKEKSGVLQAAEIALKLMETYP